MSRSGERGSSAPLVIGFMAALLLLVAVVVDASAAYLERQRLAALADGAALQGADGGAQGTSVYEGGIGQGQDLRISRVEAERAVLAYLREVRAYDDRPGLRAAVSVQGDRVVVQLSAPLDLPLAVPGAPSSPRIASTGSAIVDPDL